MVGINSNIAASSATRNLTAANNVVSSSIAKLSSGNRIIKASDDVAGLAIGTSLKSTVKTLEISLLNTEQARSVLQIADGALSQVGDILTRQKSLATQANSGALSSTERGYINQEFQSLVSEIDRIVGSTSFNGITLLNGDVSGSSTTKVSAPASYATVGTPGASVTGVSLSSFADPTFQGKGFGTISVVDFHENTGTGGEDAVFRTQIGDKVYISAALTANNVADGNITAATTLAFTATDGSGSAFTLTLAAAAGVLDTSGTAATYATTLTTALSGVDIYQNRTLDSVVASAAVGTAAAGVGAVTIKGNTFDSTKLNFGDITSISGIAGTGSASSISLVINGKTFNATDIGNSGNDDEVLDTQDTNLVLTGRDLVGNATGETITIDISGLTSVIHTQNQDEVSNFVGALKGYLGVGTGAGSGGLSFQIGSSVDDSIGVSINSVKTTDIYKNDAGVTKVLDITTQTGAQDAIGVLDNAIKSVTGRRADVGAAISRFDFAASNLEVSIANQDAARGNFLDVDTATESTNFATAQVKLQASIAVLAQANSIPRNLLTLLQ